MTPSEFELAQELIEQDYIAGRIGKLTYIKRMSALGLNDIDRRREELRELDAKRKPPVYMEFDDPGSAA